MVGNQQKIYEYNQLIKDLGGIDLKQYGLKEDLEGSTAFYIVRNKSNDVLMYFSLKCGELFEPFFDEAKGISMKWKILFKKLVKRIGN